jgi:hypothetical protein
MDTESQKVCLGLEKVVNNTIEVYPDIISTKTLVEKTYNSKVTNIL